MSTNITRGGNVAGMITLYNSQPAVIDNIQFIIDQVERLYIVDNSEITDSKLVENLLAISQKVNYISNKGNLGIARALNVAANAALADGFAYLLLMDDDSEAPANLVSELLGVYSVTSSTEIGIVAAQSDPSVPNTNSVKDVLTIITSGSLLNLEAYKSVGPFLEDLFIDWVDLEYCFRLQQHGYKVLVHDGVRLNHRLGTFQTKRLFGLLPIRWRSHSPTRLYYKFRNSQYVMRQYRRQVPLSFVGSIYYELGRDLVKILFVETNKRIYLASIWMALNDGFRGKLGKLKPKA
ncbi:glycosyltransferase [Spirosoma sp. KUDC1026]|uniref:glycosyltransferase n=1 Tax=Spirosoma sp. KUDC1026 TaxID=2745947 RepID=UPI00159BBF43|nr:glycosyltransferase [Spirosoma sp. KUDC1026]QKZ11937.1 glycosyltransferase [Spirosoma sp. KUDC1026]